MNTQNPLAILNNLRIAEPCPASWEQMTGDAHARHCEQCDLKVFDLSSLPAADAAKVVAEAGGERLCVRLRRRDDGTTVTADLPAPRIDRRSMFGRLAALAASAFGIASLSGCGKPSEPPLTGAVRPLPSRVVMGDLAPLQGEVQMGGVKSDANAPAPSDNRPLMGKLLMAEPPSAPPPKPPR